MSFVKQISQWIRQHQFKTLLIGLMVLLLGNFVLRAVLEDSAHNLIYYFKIAYADTLSNVYSRPWYQLLLPIKEWTGSWTSTSLVLLPPLTNFLGSYSTLYILLNLVFVSVAVLTSWFAFRSLIFSLTMGLCAAFTTYNYHVYSCSGSVNQYLIVSYLLMVLLGHYKLLTTRDKRNWWRGFWGVSLLLYVLSYEGWLDYVVYLWLTIPFFLFVTRKHGDTRQFNHLVKILSIVTVTALIYVVLKVKLGYGQSAGSESDTIFNYKYPIVGLEDLIGNVITIFYTIITVFIPGELISSNSLRFIGDKKLIAMQNGYHADKSFLVPMHHLFLWRFYAGFALAVFLYWLSKLGRSILQKPVFQNIVPFCFMMMIITGAPMHAIVKWRPMHALPYMGYHFYFGVIGVMLLMAYCCHWLYANRSKHRWAWGLICLIWVDVLLCAFLKPPYLSFAVKYLGVGAYAPRPLKVLLKLLSAPFR